MGDVFDLDDLLASLGPIEPFQVAEATEKLNALAELLPVEPQSSTLDQGAIGEVEQMFLSARQALPRRVAATPQEHRDLRKLMQQYAVDFPEMSSSLGFQ